MHKGNVILDAIGNQKVVNDKSEWQGISSKNDFSLVLEAFKSLQPLQKYSIEF